MVFFFGNQIRELAFLEHQKDKARNSRGDMYLKNAFVHQKDDPSSSSFLSKRVKHKMKG